MKVKIQNRSVYHKFAEIEIDIPDLIEGGGCVQQYLINNEDLYIDKIDKAMSEANFVYGTGLYDFPGMDDAETDSEWRYEAEGIGGHL